MKKETVIPYFGDKKSNYPSKNTEVVQAWSPSLGGWVDTKHGGVNVPVANTAANRLLAESPRLDKARIVPARKPWDKSQPDRGMAAIRCENCGGTGEVSLNQRRYPTLATCCECGGEGKVLVQTEAL